MSIKLTKKQAQILDFIKDYMETHDFAPSYREIAAGMGLSSVASVAEHVNNLVMIGALRKTDKGARSLEVVDLSFPETTTLFQARMNTGTAEEREILQKAAKILGIDINNPINL